jgi:hypothetical protein
MTSSRPVVTGLAAMSDAFGVRIEWLDAPGVSTPELESTWARYEIWIDDRCVTQVEESDGTFRRSVYGSLYPLAEWIAANWWVLGNDIRPLLRALGAATTAATKARNTLQPLYEATSTGAGSGTGSLSNAERPWTAGYRMAQRVRQALEVPSIDRFDVSPWVGKATHGGDSAGIQGIAAVAQSRCGLVQGDSQTGFGQARALGRVLTRPQQQSFILSAARSHDERVAGAFAAELLAPAEGIRQALDALGGRLDDAAFDAVVRRFRVSALVIRHQYDNQLAGVSDATDW